MRLIDADALNPKFVHGRWDDRYVSEKEVQDAPTVEPIKVVDVCKECWRNGGNAVEVVRCKDCRWWDKKDGANYGYCHAAKHGYFSKHWEISIYRTYKPDFFCADGERRSE